MDRITPYARGLCEKFDRLLTQQSQENEQFPQSLLRYLWHSWHTANRRHKILSLSKKIVLCIVEDYNQPQNFDVLARLEKIKPTAKLVEIVRLAVVDNDPTKLRRLYKRLGIRKGVRNAVAEEFSLKRETRPEAMLRTQAVI